MAGGPQDSPIAESAKHCLAGLTSLCDTLKDPDTCSKFDLSYDESCGHVGRFRIWANNIGSLQDVSKTTSLEYRLRDAPKIIQRILELLEDINESLDDVTNILSGERENRSGTLEVLEDEDSGDSDAERPTSQGSASDSRGTSEVKELFQCIGDTISSLFKISVLIRNATPRDRYAKAANSTREAFDASFDIAHVGHKHPKLEHQEWLKVRLGSAITRRRQYLRYCRDHHAKLAMDSQPVQHLQETEARGNGIPQTQPPKLRASSAGASQTMRSMPTSTLAPTMASTLMPAAVEVEEEIPDDAQSQMSEATSMAEDESNRLRVESLDDVSKGIIPFECHYCFGIHNIKRERAWRKHVFHDLKAYICTFPDPACELKMFEDRAAWFAHELEHHRLEWRCHFCLNLTYTTQAEFEDHLCRRHGKQIKPEHISAVVKVSQRPLTRLSSADCPLCSEWDEALRRSNPQIGPQEILTVSASQFRHHLGNHLEQLALFAIPRGTDDNDDEAGSAEADAGAEVDALSSHQTGASIHGLSNNNTPTPLHQAASKGLEWEVQRLIEDGADVNSWDDQFGTPLHAAVGHDYHSIVQILVDAGAEVLTRNPQQESALAIAVKRGKLTTIRYLLDLPAYQEPESSRDELSSILEDAAPQEMRITNILLNSDLFKAGPTDALKSQALLAAVKSRNSHLVEFLLTRFGHPDVHDGEGRAALLISASQGDLLTMEHLIAAGANVNIRRRGAIETPLSSAVSAKHWRAVKLLLQSGAKPDENALRLVEDNEEIKELLKDNMPLNATSSEILEVDGAGNDNPTLFAAENIPQRSSLRRGRPVRSSSIFIQMVQAATRDDRILVDGSVLSANALVERLSHPESDAEDYPMAVIEALVRRLGVPMASIQKRTVSLAHYLAKFGGENIRRELISVEFLYALASLAVRETVAQDVRELIVQTLTEWSEVFNDDYDTSALQGALMACFEPEPGGIPDIVIDQTEADDTSNTYGAMERILEADTGGESPSWKEASVDPETPSGTARIELLNAPDTSTVAYVKTITVTNLFTYDLVRRGEHWFIRKTIHSGTTKRDDILRELRFLQRLRHNHIMKVVSSYSLKGPNNTAIFLQPAVQCSLEQFLDPPEEKQTHRARSQTPTLGQAKRCVTYFFSCMASAVESVHRKSIVHGSLDLNAFFVSFHSQETTPELVYMTHLSNFEKATVTNTGIKGPESSSAGKGATIIDGAALRAEDILRLGLVFAEMMASISDKPRQPQYLAQQRSATANLGQEHLLESISNWAESFSSKHLETTEFVRGGSATLSALLPQMLATNPMDRPLAAEVLNTLGGQHPCCVVMRPSSREPSPTGNRQVVSP